MSYWENKKNAAIATELSISVRTVETILYKVVKKLRGEIKKSKKTVRSFRVHRIYGVKNSYPVLWKDPIFRIGISMRTMKSC